MRVLPAGELGLAWTSGARAHDESRRTVQKAAGRAPPAGGETAGPCLPAVWETLDLLPYMIWQLPRAAFVQYHSCAGGCGWTGPWDGRMSLKTQTSRPVLLFLAVVLLENSSEPHLIPPSSSEVGNA